MNIKTIKNKEKFLLLSKYYKINWKTSEVVIPLYYENATDVVFENGSDNSTLELRPEVLERISDIMDCFPKKFKCCIELTINNYNGYDHHGVMDAITSDIELFYYKCNEEKKKTWLKANLFFLVASIFLLVENIISVNFGEDNLVSIPIVTSVCEVVAWVLTWSAVEIIFLFDLRYNGISKYLVSKLNNIKILNNKNKKTLVAFNKQDMIKNWNMELPIIKIGNAFMLISFFLTVLCTVCYVGVQYWYYLEEIYDVETILDWQALITICLVLFMIAMTFVYYKSEAIGKTMKAIFMIMFCIAFVMFIGCLINQFGSIIEFEEVVILSYVLICSFLVMINCVGFYFVTKPTGVEREILKFNSED